MVLHGGIVMQNKSKEFGEMVGLVLITSLGNKKFM